MLTNKFKEFFDKKRGYSTEKIENVSGIILIRQIIYGTLICLAGGVLFIATGSIIDRVFSIIALFSGGATIYMHAAELKRRKVGTETDKSINSDNF